MVMAPVFGPPDAVSRVVDYSSCFCCGATVWRLLSTTDNATAVKTSTSPSSTPPPANPTARGGAHTLVTFADGHTAPFDVVAMDRTSDIAVVQARGTSGLTPITLGSSDHLRVGRRWWRWDPRSARVLLGTDQVQQPLPIFAVVSLP